MSRRSSSSGGGELLLALFGMVFCWGFVLAAWPYLLGTWLAVAAGASNPSIARTVTGCALEVVYVAGLIAWFVQTRDARAQRAAEKKQQRADFIASNAVYRYWAGRSFAYRHGTCTINHTTPDTAARCRGNR
jgi:hypothetical protein